jgi:4-amino-4-deoxy-L-arabinose transferase-like glycosyltransferase
LFDPVIAWVSAGVLYGTDLLWRFSVSGLSTMLLLLLFVGLVWCLVWLEEEARESRRSVVIFVLVAMAAGVLVGLGGLTRYAYAWMILPVVIYLLLVAGQRRFLGAALVFVAFALVFAPWIVRNYRISGTPLGTAGYALYETSALFPEQTLQRSLEPDFSRGVMAPLTEKLLSNTRNILQNEFPKFAGGWVGIFFMAGLLVGFPHPSVSRLRYFLIACLGVFVVVQALGRTQLSEMIPEINSENLLVLFVPLVVIYGVSFFFLLLNQIVLPIRELRYVFIALFFLSTCFPLGFSLLPPKTIPIVYPPYYPPALQSVGTSLKPNELMMSDIPWASAWYGRVQAMWLTLSPRGFMEINDYQKPIQALYISPATMDSRFLSHWIQPGEDGWSNLILQTPSAAGNSQDPMVQWPKHITLAMRRPGEQPVPFPLHYFHPGWPQQLILTSRSQPIGGP